MSGGCRAAPPMARACLLRRRPRSAGLVDAFRMLADPAPEGLALLDEAGRLVVANPALISMAGPIAARRPGLPVAPILAPAARAEFAAAMAAALAGDKPPLLQA